MLQISMPRSPKALVGERETGHSDTGGPDGQSVATLGEPYTPRTGRAETRRQDRGARRV